MNHNGIDEAGEMMHEIACEGDLDDGTQEFLDGLQDPAAFWRMMVFAHQRKIRELEKRIEELEPKNSSGGKRKFESM